MKFILLALLTTFTYANVLPKAKDDPSRLYRTKSFTKAESKKAVDFWTPERIKQAIPDSLHEISQAEAKRQGIDIDLANLIIGADSKTIRAVVPHVNNTEFPFSAMGKLLSTYNDPTAGPGITCTAQYVYNNTFAIAISAGHCSFNCSTFNFFDNYAFYQEYENGKYTLRQIQNVGVLDALCDSSNNYDYAFDYAFIQLDPISENRNIILDTHVEKYDKFVSYGYPTNYGNGAILESYSGGKGIIQAGKVQMPNNPMDQGSDGGAWLAPGDRVIGLNAFRVKGVPGVWSPEFNNQTTYLLDYILSQGVAH